MKKITQEDFIRRIKEVHNDDIQVLGEYTGRRNKVLVRHKCGYEWLANPEPLWNGHGCPKCSHNLKRTTESFKQQIFNLVGTEYEILGEYINNSTPILFKHNACGHTFFMAPKPFIQQGQRCPYERYERTGKSNSHSENYVKTLVKELEKGQYEIIGNYKKASEKVVFIHHECGKTFEMPTTRFIKGGNRCPYCYRSRGEEVIRDFFIRHGTDFTEQYRIKGCKNKRSLPFDFAIFKTNKLYCLIEYDGSQHYGIKFGSSEREYQRLLLNDSIKSKYCKEHNIPLLRIKYVRSENPVIFKEKVIKKLKKEFANLNMTIPSEATEKSVERVTTR